MFDIQYQCFNQTSAERYASVYFLNKLQFISVSRTALKDMKPDFLPFDLAFSLETRTLEQLA